MRFRAAEISRTLDLVFDINKGRSRDNSGSYSALSNREVCTGRDQSAALNVVGSYRDFYVTSILVLAYLSLGRRFRPVGNRILGVG